MFVYPEGFSEIEVYKKLCLLPSTQQYSPSSQETAKLLLLCGLNAAVIIGYICSYDSLKQIASRCL